MSSGLLDSAKNAGRWPEGWSDPLPRLLLWFSASAATWLVVGLALLIVAGVQVVNPAFLGGVSFLSFGRLVPVGIHALVYGWGSLAAMAAMLYLLSRLGGVTIASARLPYCALAAWNLALLLGLCAIAAGGGNGLLLLELPPFAMVTILLAYAATAIWGYALFRERRIPGTFASSWYLVAGMLCFPWLIVTGNVLLVWLPVPGPAQAPVAAWFAGGMLNLWLAPVSLAAIFYIVPQVLGRRLAAYNLSQLGFWSFMLFAAWCGLGRMVGGPVPAWMASVGFVTSFLMVIPVLIVGVNVFGVLKGTSEWTLPLRHAAAGIGAFAGTYLLAAILAVPPVAGVFNFTDIAIAVGLLGVGGFVTLSLSGLIQFVLPHFERRDPLAEKLGSWHFWLTVIGVGAAAVCLVLGGILQGFAQADPGIVFSHSVDYVMPFRFLALLGLLIFLAGAVCLFLRVHRALIRHLITPS